MSAIDPIIRSLEETGLPPWNNGREPVCPVCGEVCDTFYMSAEGDIVGCGKCISICDAWELVNE